MTSGPVRAASWIIPLLLPLAVHAPELSDQVSSNPVYYTAGLTSSWHAPLLPGPPGWIDPNAGFNIQAIGGLAARQWLQGRAPWWNPFTGVGMPLAAQAQNAAMFFPFVLLLRFFDGVLYLKVLLQMLAGLAAWALLRQMGRSRLAACIGAALFALGGTFAWFAHAAIMPIAFLPVLLLGIERASAAARAGLFGGWAWITVGIGWSLLAGFPETAYIDGLLALAWAILRVAQAGPARWVLAAKIGIGGTAGLLIAAPLVVPLTELLPLAGNGVHGLVAHIAVRPFVFALYLLPYVYGPIGGFGYTDWGYVGGYVGLPAVLLAAMALTKRGPDGGLRWLLAAWIIVSLLKAADAPLVTDAVNLVPGIGQTMFMRLVQPSWQMACAVLAAMAVDDWQRVVTPNWRHCLAAAAVLTAALIAGLAEASAVLRLELHQVQEYWIYLAASLGWAALTGGVLIWLLAGRCTGLRAGLLAMVAVGDAAVMASVPLLSAVGDMRLDENTISWLRDQAGLQRFATLGPYAPNYGAWFSTAGINYNTLPTPQAWVDHVRRALDPLADDVDFTGSYPPSPEHTEFLRQHIGAFQDMGVRFVLAFPGSNALPQPVLRSTPVLDVYELPHPAAYWQAEGCALAPQGREILRADCGAPAMLIRRELFFPGWRATVNAAAVPITQAPPLFQSVALPAGHSEVRFAYAPPYAPAAWIACATGLAMLAVGLGLTHARGASRYSPA